MFLEDQKAIQKGEITNFSKIIIKNKKRLDQIIKKEEWPTSERFGKKAENAAWLIAQHSDFDVTFQEKCLSLIKNLPKNKDRIQDIAYLTDRILANKKRKQIYGTQFYTKNGVLTLCPVKDIKNLEIRRKKMGLISFKKYKKMMRGMKKNESS